ncbi:GNAT family N-acetyltransferase [Altererythrobacter sp. B11]|uniref:GNAT family N-acetyltransferase n=1 Tax=Altererythrobacter sp. B11 TaxID=2060312 RepID=UPI001E5FDEC9|nr:GNAT family N-acetyltransferase [Altererythrobacter sp. B11]
MVRHASTLTMPDAALPGSGRPVPALALMAEDWRRFDSAAERTQWDALAQWAAEPNPFHESWYLLPALRALDTTGEVKLLCLTADGQLAGLLPVKRQSRYYGHRLPHWANWIHDNAFLGTPLVAPGFEGIFWRQVLAWCDARAGCATFLHLSQLPTEGPLHRALAAACASRKRPAASVWQEERAMLASPLSPEEYLEQALSGKKRKELRRQHRRLAEEGDLTVERTASAAGLHGWAREFLELERAGWKGTAGSALACAPQTRDLFLSALAGAARHGRLERLAIRLNGRPLAMLVNFLCPPGAFSYKTAFDEGFARFSPGVLLQRENLALLAQPGIAWADSCAAADHPMIDHFWRERRAIARYNVAIGGAVHRMAFRMLAKKETGSFPRGIA